jgi:hypothetical protein
MSVNPEAVHSLPRVRARHPHYRDQSGLGQAGSEIHHLFVFLYPFLDVVNIDSYSSLAVAHGFQAMIIDEIPHTPVILLSQGRGRFFDGEKPFVILVN